MGFRKRQAAILSALTATCVFGRMSFIAGASLFENPDPTTFQQLANLWAFLYWTVPALLIGTICAPGAATIAAAVNLLGGAILLAMEYPHVVPIGAALPDASMLWGIAAEMGTGLLIALVNVLVVRMVFRWLAKHVSLRQPSSCRQANARPTDRNGSSI